MVLDVNEVSDRDKVSRRLGYPLSAVQRSHEVEDDLGETTAASGSQPSSASRAHLDTYTMPSTCGMISRSACRILLNTAPPHLISSVTTHSSDVEML